MRLVKFFLVAFCCVAFVSAGQAKTLKGKQLRSEVTGKTIYLSVAAGVELPIRYRAGGTMYGKLKGLIALVPTGMPSKDKGRWWITKNRLCQAWNKWLKQKAYCYKLRKVKGQVFWYRNDGRSGTARIVSH